jgi:hypothetical protein
MTNHPVSVARLCPRWVLPFAFALCGYLILALCSTRAGRLPLGVWWAVQLVGWISCAWFLRAVRNGWPAMGWIVTSALVFRICGLWATPSLEDDYQRYLWDGWRTIQDGSPYGHAPQEFFAVPEKRPPGIETALNDLNHPDLTTIYAPVTQLLFAAAAAIAPGSLLCLKLLLLLVDAALLLLLGAFGGRAAAWFYGWCPLVVTEIAFHAHPEGWALLWLIAAWICARRERYLYAGVLAGVAVSAKLFALLAVPFLARRKPFVFVGVLLAVWGIIYAPLLAAGSSAEWTGLHAMASYFEFNSFGYAMLAHCFGPIAARLLWLILFCLIAGFFFARWFGRRQSLHEAPVADVMLVFFLLSPVLNPWYLVWLVPFAAAQPTARSVALLIVVPLSYATGLNLGDATLATYAQPLWVRPVEFGIVILAALRSLWPLKLAPEKFLLR